MTHDVTITNNTGTKITLRLLLFFTRVDGEQLATILDGEEHAFQAECYPPQVLRRLRAHCTDQGIDYKGLSVTMGVIEAVEG